MCVSLYPPCTDHAAGQSANVRRVPVRSGHAARFIAYSRRVFLLYLFHVSAAIKFGPSPCVPRPQTAAASSDDTGLAAPVCSSPSRGRPRLILLEEGKPRASTVTIFLFFVFVFYLVPLASVVARRGSRRERYDSTYFEFVCAFKRDKRLGRPLCR